VTLALYERAQGAKEIKAERRLDEKVQRREGREALIVSYQDNNGQAARNLGRQQPIQGERTQKRSKRGRRTTELQIERRGKREKR
jgi:hypothetical protein